MARAPPATIADSQIVLVFFLLYVIFEKFKPFIVCHFIKKMLAFITNLIYIALNFMVPHIMRSRLSVRIYMDFVVSALCLSDL